MRVRDCPPPLPSLLECWAGALLWPPGLRSSPFYFSSRRAISDGFICDFCLVSLPGWRWSLDYSALPLLACSTCAVELTSQLSAASQGPQKGLQDCGARLTCERYEILFMSINLVMQISARSENTRFFYNTFFI